MGENKGIIKDQFMQDLGDVFKDAQEKLAYKKMLSAARYAYHKQIQHKYCLFMQTGMTREDAIEKYNKSMINYDSIIANAVNGASQEANEADMAKGFG